MLAYSIEAALRADYVDRVVVSTESEVVAEAAIKWGAEVPFMRPPVLAGDNASLDAVIRHAFFKLENNGYRSPEHLVLLPTSPFRSRGLMNRVCELLRSGHRSVETVRPVSPRLYCQRKASGAIQRVKMDESQTAFRSYGLVGGQNRNGLKRPFMLRVEDPIMLIDIDTPDDFALAEQILRDGAFDFNGHFEG